MRRSSFFIIGFYTLAVVCLALILRFGVLQAINPPSETLRGLFVLSCAVAGFVGGGVAIFFWQGTKYFIGGWGGFAFALFIQALHNGGMIKPLGFRYLFYIGMSFHPYLSSGLTRRRLCGHRLRRMHHSQDSLSSSSGLHRYCRRFGIHVGS